MPLGPGMGDWLSNNFARAALLIILAGVSIFLTFEVTSDVLIVLERTYKGFSASDAASMISAIFASLSFMVAVGAMVVSMMSNKINKSNAEYERLASMIERFVLLANKSHDEFISYSTEGRLQAMVVSYSGLSSSIRRATQHIENFSGRDREMLIDLFHSLVDNRVAKEMQSMHLFSSRFLHPSCVDDLDIDKLNVIWRQVEDSRFVVYGDSGKTNLEQVGVWIGKLIS